jgi:hypothetical protein
MIVSEGQVKIWDNDLRVKALCKKFTMDNIHPGIMEEEEKG